METLGGYAGVPAWNGRTGVTGKSAVIGRLADAEACWPGRAGALISRTG